jgi:hypothetical protein
MAKGFRAARHLSLRAVRFGAAGKVGQPGRVRLIRPRRADMVNSFTSGRFHGVHDDR